VVRTNSSQEVRESAIVGISDMSSADATTELAEIALSNQNKEIRSTAMAMLGDRNDEQALKTLEKIAWFDPDADVRSSAIAMMSEMKDAVPVLLKIVDDHPSKRTREVALQMLAETVAGREVLKEKLKQ
jgi:HEAT repeat protein